jgi:heme A synthase
MSYVLRRADPVVKWLVTCLLGTCGLAYLFGAWMVGLYSGFSPNSVARTFHSPSVQMTMPASTRTTQQPVTMQQMAGADHYTIDRDLLIQDTHVHVLMYGLIATALSLIVVGLEMPRRDRYALVTLCLSAPWLDFLGMWGAGEGR